MHYKKPKTHKLHSIPIGLCKNRHLVSYSIPLSCMVVLLLGGIVAINPSLPLKTNAVTIQDEWVVKEKDDKLNSTNNVVEDESVDDSFGGFGGDGVELSQADADTGISTLSAAPAPTLAIAVSNTNQIINAVQGGNTVYGSYNVSLSGSNIKDYALSIKADSNTLTMPSSASSSTSTVSGVGNGTIGSSIGSNKWGYVVTDTSTNNYDSLIYKTVPTSATNIANGTISSPYNLSTSKKLVFAAKFGDNAAPGQYSGKITLSATASQAILGQLWSNGVDSWITDMQDIGGGFCKDNSKISKGDTISLKDSRDKSLYKVVKLDDGNCWMQENLHIVNRTLTTTDSDLTTISSFTIPASSILGFVDSEMNTPRAYYEDNDTTPYGAYYNLYTARAGGSLGSDSICPKNWKLPSDSEYRSLLSEAGIFASSATERIKKITSLPYNFPKSGQVYDNTLHLSAAGIYWTSTSGPWLLRISSSNVDILSGYSGRYGFSMRCMARY